jgi:lipoprotein-anchoring transpeptidase ErfK/SrfK
VNARQASAILTAVGVVLFLAATSAAAQDTSGGTVSPSLPAPGAAVTLLNTSTDGGAGPSAPVTAPAPAPGAAPGGPVTRYPLLFDESLELGKTGDKVRILQGALKQFVPVEVTGIFDHQTVEAVRTFQTANSIKPDGNVGDYTFGVLWNKLFWEKNQTLYLDGAEFAKHVKSLRGRLKISVDLARQRAYLVDSRSGEVLRAYPISSGRPPKPDPDPAKADKGFPTPEGTFKIIEITEKPWWNPPPPTEATGTNGEKTQWPSPNAKPIEPGPDNPMGCVKMRVTKNVFLHGVPRNEWGPIGKRPRSHGCMRMFPHHAWELHRLIRVGTPVEIATSVNV